jgi:FkbH-like protein
MYSPEELAKILRSRRWQLGEALLASIADWDKYSRQVQAGAEARREFVRLEMLCFVDYLATYIERGDTNYRDLYIGEKLKQCYEPTDSAENFFDRKKRITESDRAIFIAELRALVSPTQLDRLTETLDCIHRIVTDPGRMRARVLFVGDCLHLDVVSFLVAPLLTLGITLEPTFATSKNPIELERFLRDLDGRVFDLVFFSPFSYEFHAEYSELLFMRTALAGRSRVNAIVESAQADTLNILRTLGYLFEAPIMVHNSANIRRHSRTLPERAKNLATFRARSVARDAMNTWLPNQLEDFNSRSFGHYLLLDEAALLQQNSEYELGVYFSYSELNHPAHLGRIVSGLYQDAIIAKMLLANKKVIVCDLDNTLWKGVIGEGGVSHFRDRQKILKSLRDRGMLLAVSSKNDPRNVNWNGGELNEDDFVTAQINWDSKVLQLRRIADDLNLKLKDFLFVDDRADERAAIAAMIPEVETLDAESPDVWRRLALLAKLLPEQDEIDRTLAYKQRAQREGFLADRERLEDKEREFFRGLKLTLTIRSAEPRELKRVVELINRTNQFNLCGSRTTLKEVTGWHRSQNHSILLVEATDKFGNMGIVSVAVTIQTFERVEIPVFVLSCRVFGYGVEKALLNFIRRSAGHRDGGIGKPVFGLYLETAYNEPCRNSYPESGFVWEEGRWIYRSGPDVEDPDWLTVEARA